MIHINMLKYVNNSQQQQHYYLLWEVITIINIIDNKSSQFLQAIFNMFQRHFEHVVKKAEFDIIKMYAMFCAVDFRRFFPHVKVFIVTNFTLSVNF